MLNEIILRSPKLIDVKLNFLYQFAKVKQTAMKNILMPVLLMVLFVSEVCGQADTLYKIIPDDYPVTNKMLEPEVHHRESGEITDGEGGWFSNDTLKETLVFVLHTDYFRNVTYHFLNSDIPPGIIKRMQLHIIGTDNLASDELRKKYFKGFLTQTTKIETFYFTTNKGFKLGDSKEKAFRIYGNPDKAEIESGIEKYEWDFIGEDFYDGKTDLKGKPLAKNSFGHQTVMFFRDNKLIGIIFHNDIP